MKVLIDIVHPVEIHLFRNLIGELKEKGHNVTVTLREKDNAEQLLINYGIDYIKTNSKRYGSILTAAAEYISRFPRLFKIIREVKPDIMIGQTTINIAPLGFLLGIPVIHHTDTDSAYHDYIMTFPFVKVILTPECFDFKAPFLEYKHIGYPGYKELAYLHPARFSPDPLVKREIGANGSRKIVILRFSSLNASHDLFVKGIPGPDKQRLVEELKDRADIFISSEYELPGNYACYRYPLDPGRFLDFLSICDLYIGESPTVATEACLLGIPAVYISSSPRSYTTELEKRYGLCRNFKPGQMDEAIEYSISILEGLKLPKVKFEFDLTSFMLELIEKYAGS